MVSQSSFEDVAIRYGQYIRELQEFFSGRGMKFGTPRDMFRLAERVEKPSFFRDEMASMIRAIIFRERETVTRAELLELVALAIGGPEVGSTHEDLHDAIDQLSTFLTQVLRSLWGSVPDEVVPPEPSPAPTVEQSDAPQAAPDPLPEAPVADVESAPPALVVGHSNGNALDEPAASIPAPPASAHRVLSRALVMSSEEQESESDSEAPVWRRRIGLVAACALFVALSGVLVKGFYHHPQAPDAFQTAAQTPALGGDPAGPSAAYPAASPDTAPYASEIPAASPAIDSGEANVPERSPNRDDRRGVHQKRAPEISTYTRDVETASSIAARNAEASFARGAAAPKRSSSGKPAITKGSDAGVFFVSSGLMTDNLLSAPAPDYPKLAKLAHIEGPVILQVVVSPQGTVSASRVLDGHFLLRSAAEHAVRRWTYRPYVLKGRATDISTIVTIDFRLHH